MGKVLVDFDAISYRNHLIGMKNQAHQEYLKHKGTLTAMSWESIRNAFGLALERMEEFATFEKVSSQ